MDTQSTLAELVSGHPGAARVFHALHLDFCCGGARSLAEVCAREGLDAAAVLHEIEASERPGGGVNPAGLGAGELVDFILERYHAPLRRELPRLIELAGRVEGRHADKPECPRGLALHLETMARSIEEHLAKEEQILFPLIQAGRGHLAHMPVRVMIQEHHDHAANLARLRELADGYRVPPCACASWRVLYEGLSALELDLMEHIHLENNVLFPRALAR
jgi:regulator of cell morphogenesis and NO signaling